MAKAAVKAAAVSKAAPAKAAPAVAAAAAAGAAAQTAEAERMPIAGSFQNFNAKAPVQRQQASLPVVAA